MKATHPLAAWISARMTNAEFARRLGISKSHLTLVLQGKRGISLDLASKIEGQTEGEFTANRLQREQHLLTEVAEAAAQP